MVSVFSKASFKAKVLPLHGNEDESDPNYIQLCKFHRENDARFLIDSRRKQGKYTPADMHNIMI